MAIRPEVTKPFDGVKDGLTGNSPAAVRRRIEALEHLLEGLVTIPGINRKVGLDVFLSFIPVGGSAVAAALGSYLAWEARNLGMSKWQLLRMAGNVAVDTALGAVPLAGDVFDFLFRSNSRNLRIVKRHLDRHHPAPRVIDVLFLEILVQ